MDSPMMLGESQTLLNAQISFLNTHVALVHIPMKAYPHFLHPISQLLLHNTNYDDDDERIKPKRPWEYWHPLVNISIAHNECSIACPRELAVELFAPVISGLRPELQKGVTISKEDYSVIVIGGEGLEAGQRVLDLSSPLALAKIPIFFITSYWSDFILVPLKSRTTVISALEDRGFLFEADLEPDSEAGLMTNPASPLFHSHSRNGSHDSPPMPMTPPPATVSELQQRTFKLLKTHKITPQVDHTIELVTCAGIKDNTPFLSSSAASTQAVLHHGLLKCLTAPEPPRFLSLTLTASDSASLTLEKRLLTLFSANGEDVLLGKDGPEQVPITLDLRELPLESTGIVCGVASRLVDGMRGRSFGGGSAGAGFEMSYLSTARAGHVVVFEDELEDAMEILQGLGEGGD